jgi:release factor glutamine methyltransferase
MTVSDPFYAAVVARLAAAGCVAAAEEATEFLTAAPDDATLESWLQRREQGEPLAWIIGTISFCGLILEIDPGVYVPRLQSEDLARRAARLLPEYGRAIDLCTAAGVIASHMKEQVPTAMVIGVDIDPVAAACARRNGVPTVVGDMADAIRAPLGFDIVTAVAPYVPTGELRLLSADVQRYEPRRALDGGSDGLELVRLVIDAAVRLLKPGGWVLAELGGDQDEAVAPYLVDSGFDRLTPWWDSDGDLRGIAARRMTA